MIPETLYFEVISRRAQFTLLKHNNKFHPELYCHQENGEERRHAISDNTYATINGITSQVSLLAGTRRRRAVEKKVCFIQGCDNHAAYSRKVRVIRQRDYEIEMELCSRHRNRFKEGEAALGLDLEAFGKEMLLGETDDVEKRRKVNNTFEYMQKHAEASNIQQAMQLVVNLARHLAKAGDARFLFGFYFGELFSLSSFKDFGTDSTRRRRAEQIRGQMSLREPYEARQHPDTSNELINICRCGHEQFMHEFGEPRGACYTCLCPRYEFEQRVTRREAIDLQSLMSSERKA